MTAMERTVMTAMMGLRLGGRNDGDRANCNDGEGLKNI